MLKAVIPYGTSAREKGHIFVHRVIHSCLIVVSRGKSVQYYVVSSGSHLHLTCNSVPVRTSLPLEEN